MVTPRFCPRSLPGGYIKQTFDREPFIEEFVGHFQEEEKLLPESEANDLWYNEYQAAVFSRRSDSTRLDSTPCV